MRVAASENINDEDIHYEIKEVNEGYTVDTSNLTGREITFNVKHKASASQNETSQPLTYQITAYTLNEKGERDIVSNTFTLKQDTKSQIRQEYIDKHCLNSDFNIPTPNYDSIKDQSEFPSDSPYYFECFSNDHFPGYTILDDSLYTALQNIKEHLGQARPFIVGAWYNPRKNDSIQRDEVNSLHQSGNALDLVPSYCSTYWPAGAKTYKEATACLLGAVLCCIDLSKFNAYIEGNHVHLEKAIPSSWYSLELPDQMGDSPVYLSDVDMTGDETAGEYVTVLIDDGTGARGYVLIDGEWVLANEAANTQSLLRTYSVSGNYLSITKSISVKVNQKINELLVAFLNKMKINRADLDSQDINSILNGLAFSVDDNVLFGLLQKAFGKTQPIDDYYFMRGKSYTDAVFFAWFLKSSAGSAIAALDAIKNAGVAQTFALATSETVVGGVALEAGAVEEAARAAVMAGVSVGFAVMANHSRGILRSDIEGLKETTGYKFRENIESDLGDPNLKPKSLTSKEKGIIGQQKTVEKLKSDGEEILHENLWYEVYNESDELIRGEVDILTNKGLYEVKNYNWYAKPYSKPDVKASILRRFKKQINSRRLFLKQNAESLGVNPNTPIKFYLSEGAPDWVIKALKKEFVDVFVIKM